MAESAGRTQEGGSERTLGGIPESEIMEKFGFSISDLRVQEADEEPEPDLEPEEEEEGMGDEEAEGDEEAPAEEEAGEEEEEEAEAEGAEGDLLSEEEMGRRVRLKDGTEVTVQELVAGYMKDADYRRKTQKLAEERRALEAERGQMEEAARQFQAVAQNVGDKLWFADAFEGMIQRNPWIGEMTAELLRNNPHRAAQIIQENLELGWNSVTIPSAPTPAQQPAFRDPRVDEMLVRQKAEELKREWEEIVKEDPEADLDEVAETLRRYNLPSLKEAYRITYHEKLLQRAEEQGYRKALREAKKGGKTPSSSKRQAPRQKQAKPKPPKAEDPASIMAYMYRYG